MNRYMNITLNNYLIKITRSILNLSTVSIYMVNIFLILLTFFLLILFILYIIKIYQIIWSYQPNRMFFAPTNDETIDLIIEIINKYSPDQKGKSFYELGAGDGRVISKISTHTQFSNYYAIEYETFEFLILKLKTIFDKSYKSLIIIQEDIFKIEYEVNSVMFIYMGKHITNKLYKENFLDGKIVISLTFPIEGASAIEKYETNNAHKLLYLYDFSSKVQS